MHHVIAVETDVDFKYTVNEGQDNMTCIQRERERTGDVMNNCFYNGMYNCNKRRVGYLTRTSPIPPVISLHGPMGLHEDIISNSNSHDSLLSTTLHTVLFITSVSSLIKDRYSSYRRNIYVFKCQVSHF